MTASSKMTCPHCKNSFELTEAVSHDINAAINERVAKELKIKDEEFKRKIISYENDRSEQAKRSEREKLELKSKIEKEISESLNEKFYMENHELKSQLSEAAKLTRDFQTKELELRKQARELENKTNALTLEVARRIDEERNKLSLEIREAIDEENSRKFAEKEKQNTDMAKIIKELQRKIDSSSQQLQGEVLELRVEELIRERFPDDDVFEVKKGVSGADILHNVMMRSGSIAGVIMTECKDVKEWGAQWIGKLKTDMRDKGADHAVLISPILPKGVQNMAMVDGVWVCTPKMYPMLITLLRDQLIKVKLAQLVAETPKDQKDILFQYMTSNKFSQKVQGICEKADSMKVTLEAEKRSSLKNWKKREIEIEQICIYMAEIYGELEGVVGKALPRIEALEIGPAEVNLELVAPE